MKRLVKENFIVTVDQKNLMLKSNRMGAFTCISKNYGGKELYAVNLEQLVFTWNKLIKLGYTVEEVPVSAPRQSLYVMKFVDTNGKEISGRSIYAKEKSRRMYEHKKANNFFKGITGKELRNYMEIIEEKVKAEMKVWEADFIASLQ